MVTFSVMINLLFFSSMAIVLLKYIFKDNKVILQLDTRFLTVCMLVIACRLLIPVESPFTKNIAISKVFPDVYRLLKEPIGDDPNSRANIMMIFQFIWFAGVFVALIRLGHSYMKIRKEIGTFDEIRDVSVIAIMEKVNRQYKHPVKFRLVHVESDCTPCIFGIRRPYIVIPDIEVSEKELEFIFAHEVQHYYHGDLLVKFLCEAFKAVYWWNPFAYILSDLVSKTQEINVDFSVMRKLTGEETLDYSACLVKLTRERELCRKEEKWLMAFQKESAFSLGKRVGLMLDNLEVSRRKTIASILLSVAMVSLIAICPNIFIFEPYAIAEEDIDGSIGLRDAEIYYLKNEDGTYDVYIEDECITTVTQVHIYDENIQIYELSKEEYND